MAYGNYYMEEMKDIMKLFWIVSNVTLILTNHLKDH